MEYSKIKSIELHNFMSIEKAVVEFDQEVGLMNIKGFNDSGKSAILRALSVCLMDNFRTKQVKFIRHDCNYFRVAVTFSDGVTIVRDKYIGGQSLYEMYKGKELLFTTKQGKTLTAIKGVPEDIATYLGMCVTESTNFNYQSCVDPLPLVDTKGSENYRMLHEILKMEEIYKASALLNTDKNALNSEISITERDLQMANVTSSRYSEVDSELESIIQDLEDGYNTCDNANKHVSEVLVSFESLKDLEESYLGSALDSLVSDTAKLGLILNMVDLFDRLNEVKQQSVAEGIEKVTIVGADRYSDILGIFDNMSKLKEVKDIPVCSQIDSASSRFVEIETSTQNFSKLTECQSALADVESKIAEEREVLNATLNTLKSSGYDVHTCSTCGSLELVGGECNG